MVWYNFNFLGFLQQTCRWQMQNMLLEKIQSFNTFLNSVWEWKWVEWSCIFLEEGLFTVWINVGSLTYFVSKSMSMKTEMYSFSHCLQGEKWVASYAQTLKISELCILCLLYETFYRVPLFLWQAVRASLVAGKKAAFKALDPLCYCSKTVCSSP